MIIKAYLVNLAARITGRKCSKCTHNCSGRCCHPSGHMFAKCWQSVTRPGFEKELAVDDLIKAVQLLANRPTDNLTIKVSAADLATLDAMKEENRLPLPMEIHECLTDGEQEQLEKIKGVLQEAGDTARESGLL